MLKKVILFSSSLVVILAFLPSFAIAPGAGAAQMQNNRMQMQQNKQQIEQRRQNQELYQQNYQREDEYQDNGY